MYEDIINQAKAAAQKAADETAAIMGDRDCCGFAWIKIVPARGPLVKALKAIGLGEKSSWEPGYRISSNELIPGYFGQSMTVKEKATEAFVKVIRDAGIETSIYAQSRMD